jgi:hypothetical protein
MGQQSSEDSAARVPRPSFYSYVTHSQLFRNAKPSFDYFQDKLSGLDLKETILTTSKLNLLMTDKDYAIDIPFNRRLAEDLLDDYALEKYKKLPGTKDNFLVNRHQLLYLMKSAFMYCSQNSNTDFTESSVRNLLGRCCLLANDFIYLTKTEEKDLESSNKDHQKEILWKEFLPSYELYIPSDLKHSLGRNKIIFERILPGMPQESLFKNINQLFQSMTNISINEFRELVFTIIALYMVRRKEVTSNPAALICEIDNFTRNTNISPDIIRRVIDLISLPFDQYKDEINKSKDRDFNYGFVTFKNYPLARFSANSFICLDCNYLIDKLTTGIFWLINNSLSRSEANDFRTFWGNAFEAYINAFLLNHPDLRGGSSRWAYHLWGRYCSPRI